MRKLLVVICLLSFHLLYSQSYTVNFYQSGTFYLGNTIPDSSKTILYTYEDSNKNVFALGNYTNNSFSFVKKFNTSGQEILTVNFNEQLFYSGALLTKTNLNQFLIVGQININNSVNRLRIICLDTSFTRLWEAVTVLDNGRKYYCSDVKFDSQNNIYITGDFKVYGAYMHAFVLKYTYNANFVWERIITTSTNPSNYSSNSILNILDNSLILSIKTGLVITNNIVTLYEIEKSTGNTIKYKTFGECSSGYFPIQAIFLNNNIYLGYFGNLTGYTYQVYYFRKINLSFDTLWTKIINSNERGWFGIDESRNVYITTAEEGVKKFDSIGNLKWNNTNIKGSYRYSDQSAVTYYGMNNNCPVIYKSDLNGNILLQSELYSPYLYSFYLNTQNDNQFQIRGISSLQNSMHKNILNDKGLLIHSLQDIYSNDSASDFKYSNNSLYISFTSKIKLNVVNTYISKFSTNGSLLWNQNIFNNNKGNASIQSILPDNNTIYGTGQLNDTVTNRNNTVLVGLDNNTGNINFNFSFKDFFNTDNSGKFIKTSNGAIYIAGHYKDSLNHTKTFLAKNIGNENIWFKKFNGGVASDSLVSLSFDTLGNSFISYNSFSSSLSTEFKVIKINSSGNNIYIKSVSNPDGISLKKSETDGKGYLYLLASTKINGNYDLITQKSDTNSSPLWTDTYNNSLNTDDIGCGLVLDKNNNIIITGNIVNNQNLDALTLKISNNGERVWNKTYSTGNKFSVKDIMTDDLNVYYVYGFVKDAQGLDKQTIIEYDYNGSLRKTLDFNTRDTTVLSFSNNFMKMFVTDGLPNVKKLYSVSNVNRINRGGDLKINIFSVSSITETENIAGNTPQSYSLQQNYPNPFNPSTTINFQIPQNSFVNLKIYDINGRELLVLLNENLQAGAHKITFDGSNLPSGVYYYKLSSGNFIDTKKMVLIK